MLSHFGIKTSLLGGLDAEIMEIWSVDHGQTDRQTDRLLLQTTTYIWTYRAAERLNTTTKKNPQKGTNHYLSIQTTQKGNYDCAQCGGYVKSTVELKQHMTVDNWPMNFRFDHFGDCLASTAKLRQYVMVEYCLTNYMCVVVPWESFGSM